MLRNQRVIGLLVLVALLLCACQPIVAEPSMQAAEQDVAAAVDAIWDEYAATVVAGDVDRWIAQWTDDGVQMPPGEPLVEGKENIYNRVAAIMAAGPTDEFVITPLETTSAGDWAYSRGAYVVRFPLGDTGEQGVIDGKFMTILQRQPDGSWKIHRDIFNSNVQPAPAAAPETDVDEVAAAIDAIWREYEASLAAGDLDRWMNLWTQDGVKLSPGLLPMVGKDAIREYLTPRLEAFEYDMTITNEEVQVGGEWAVARGVYQATLTPKAGGDDIPVDGKYMTLLQRQPDGSWKIHRDIVNSNTP